MIRCVVFDLGGVLVRICRSWEQACARAGVAYHESIATAEMIERRRVLRDRYETGRIGCDEFFCAVAATTDGLISPHEFRRVHEAWVIGEYVGASALIDALHARGVTTGILSNTNHAHWTDLRQGIAQRVRHAHASHLLGVAKPHIDIYRAFERETGVTPSDILFFDDLEANVGGARAADWHAVLVDHAGDTAAQMTDVLRERGLL